MRKIALVLSLLGAFEAAAQSIQSGIVMEYRSEKQKAPLQGVAIAAANAGSTMSDAEGRFTLNFRTLKAGDAIQFRRIEKAGYEIMNREALDVAKVSRNNVMTKERDNENPKVRDFDVSIILCKTSLLNEIRDIYRSVTVKRYEKQLKEQEAEIERLKKEGKLKEEEYNERIDALEAEFEEKLSDINVYIDRFARIDMTALSEAEHRTIELVQQGRFEEAIANYESQNLVTMLNKARAERRQLSEMAEKIDMSIMSKEEENRKLRESINRQIDLLHLAGGQENMEKIHRILREVFLADTTDINARKDYASSLHNRGEVDEARRMLEYGINCATDNYEKALMALDIALNKAATDPERMLPDVCRADSLSRLVDSSNRKLNSRIVPSVCYLQLFYNLNNGLTDSCAPITERALEAWDVDSLDLLSLNDYILLLQPMSTYFSYAENHERSVWAATEGVRIDEAIYKAAPWRTSLHATCATACETMALEGRYAEAVDFARRSYSVSSEISRILPTQESLKGICDCCFRIYWTLKDMGETALADSIAQQVEPLYAKLHERQREPLKGSRGLFLLAKGDIEAATPLLNESLGEEVAAITVAPFRARKALTQPSPRGKEEAIGIMLEAIEAAKKQYNEEPDAWNKDTYCCHCITLAEIYAYVGDKKNARRWLKQAEKLVAFESNKLKISQLKQIYF